MLPVLSILILQGQLANINTLEWLRVAPARCMRALQRPWIYRGNGHILIYVSARHAAARHDHRWWGRNRDGQRQSPWLDGGCGVGNVNGSSSYSWEGESGSQARRYTTAALERVGGCHQWIIVVPGYLDLCGLDRRMVEDDENENNQNQSGCAGLQ